MKVSMKN